MGKQLKLVNKLNRRAKSVKTRSKGFDQFDKMSESEEKMAKAQGTYKLERKIQRRLDRNFGNDGVRYEPKVSKRVKATTIERFDFGVSDFGIKLTLPSGMIAAIGLQPGDIVRVLSGFAKGVYLKVISLESATEVRLEDDASMADAGAKEQTQVQAVADVAGSLDGTSFTLHSAADATAYYVWMDVDAGGNDPLGTGTGVPVSIATGDSAIVVAAAIAAAVDALADFTASSGTDTVVIENAAVGIATDSADVDSGFDISVVVQGAAADATLSDSNIHCRFQLSDVKASYK